ncbi:MAG: membrane protein insertase YidC [Clostridia bacterium]|nr:membrane protein insertase YidC [Clostridia bacterium]
MGSAIYNIVVTPLEYFIETVFTFSNALFKNPGIAIIFVSIAVQILVFPLYKKADDIQEEERLKQKSMEHWVNHIKKTFKGDERFMMQQAYYREMDYKPFYAIKGSVSLLLQIPFFMAAYHFLSHLDVLNGVSFLGIADLSKPDGLIQFGSVAINLLPVLMTFFNIISGIIYTRGLPWKDKVQTYGLAILFLVILYKSPAGLVFYWTLNNLFSLLKNVLLKLIKNPRRAVDITLILIGIGAVIYTVFLSKHQLYTRVGSVVFAVLCWIPAILSIRSKKSNSIKEKKEINLKAVNSLFYFSISAFFLLTALTIPTDAIKSSPMEFVSVNYGPFGLIFNTVCIFIGFIFVWLNIFYIFSPPKIRRVFAVLASILTATGLIDYFFFGKNLGVMSANFAYDVYPEFSTKELLLNLAVVAFAALVVFVVYLKKPEVLKRVYQIACVTLSVVIVISSLSIGKTIRNESQSDNMSISAAKEKSDKIIPISKNGKNVIVFMLDRAISGYLPYILEENPEIQEALQGFTYYPNTISFGNSTNFGSPALFGGYEYTPTEMNKRDSETLASKHNEALTVLPKLFSDNGYKVTVVDPPYAGYKWVPDLSIYNDYDGINAYSLKNRVSSEEFGEYTSSFETLQRRSAAFYPLAKVAPLAVHNTIYQHGYYWSSAFYSGSIKSFLASYIVLQNLSKMTEIKNDGSNTFLMIQNSTTHEPVTLDAKTFAPAQKDKPDPMENKTDSQGRTMLMDSKDRINHYQANVAALIKVCTWINYLKENDAFDNTRIVIVSDHGKDLGQFDYMNIDNELDVEAFNPLLMVKDFNAKEFTVSDEFMTNADAPALAVKDAVKNPVNPFTGKEINSNEKLAHSQQITTSCEHDILTNCGNTFNTSDGEWWTVKDNIFDKNNWKKVEAGK